MSKKKRVRRDIDRLFRAGRYWEFLRLLESEGIVSENAREHKKAWESVVQKAVKQKGGFGEFCREVETLKGFPNDADFRLLMLLKSFAEGRDVDDELLQLDGLTPDALKLRFNLTSCAFLCSRLDTLWKLLEKFIRDPGRITRRYYEEVADFIPAGFVESSIRHLGEWIVPARGLNNKAAVSRGWRGIDFSHLGRLDSRLQHISRSLPEHLQSILLYPFLHNIAIMCRRLAPDAGSADAAHLMQSIPFLFRRLAGDRAEEVERKLLISRGELVTEKDEDPATLSRKVEGMGLEDKVALLGGLRHRLQDTSPDESPLHDWDFLEDEEDNEDDDFLEEEHPDAVRLAQATLLLHRSVLKDISRRSPGLSSRDKRELIRVMEPVLLHDMDPIMERIGSQDEFCSFLEEIMDSGCAGVRTGLLALLAGGYYRNGNLRNRANRLLDHSPLPARQDMDWIARDWCDLYYPEIRSLKPILNRYKEERPLLVAFTSKICDMLEMDLVESMLNTEVLRLPISLREIVGISKSKGPAIVRRELNELREHDVLDLVRDLLRCHPEDRQTREGHLCWLKVLHSRKPEAAWSYVLIDLQRWERIKESFSFMLPLRLSKKTITDRIEVVLLFIQDHLDELAALPISTLEPLLNSLLDYPDIMLSHHDLLIRVEKLLADRSWENEEAFHPLIKRIRHCLEESTKRPKKCRRGGKRKP